MSARVAKRTGRRMSGLWCSAGDAICDVVHHAIDSPELPVRGWGTTLNAHMNYKTDLVNAVGTATLGRRRQLSAAAPPGGSPATRASSPMV